MESMLRILHLEDDPVDSDLAKELLEADGFTVVFDRVDTTQAFMQALEQRPYTLILADFSLPEVDAMDVLHQARRARPEVPFIFLSGTMGEETAIETLKLGATDYVLKQRIARLVPAVRRALAEAEEQTRRRQAEAALRASEEKFRVMAETVPDIIFTNRPDGLNDFCNARFYEFTGMTPDTCQALLWMEFLHPEDRDRIKTRWLHCARTGEPFAAEYRLRHRDGEYRWFFARSCPICDAEGQITKWFGSCTDIHDLKSTQDALRESEERFRTFMDHSPTVAWIKDEHGRYLYLSKTTQKCFHIGLADWYGRSDDDLWPQEIARQFHDNDQTVLSTGKPLDLVEKTVEPDGSHCYWWNFRFLIHDAAGRRYLAGVGMDITARVEAEDALKQLNEELEVRVAERTAELAQSNADLERFASVASHDLQEPLRMVASYLGLIDMRYKDRLDEDAKAYIHFAVDGAKRMQTLIRNLLEYSRVSTRGKKLEPIDAEAAFDRALQNLKVAIDESHAQVTHEPLPTVLADESQLVQVFQNLIGNALKFRRDSEPPRVHVAAECQDGRWLFRVRDNGIGISPEHRDKVFEMFHRVHTRLKYEGTGIGLAVVKRIIDRHKGKVWVESEPGKGSTFAFTLPSERC